MILCPGRASTDLGFTEIGTSYAVSEDPGPQGHAPAGELPSHPIGREAERSELKRAFCSSLSES